MRYVRRFLLAFALALVIVTALATTVVGWP